jgi:hypothetical protein
MSDLTTVIHDLVAVFEQLRLPYAIMGGIAVRAHGIPRPTYDVDFTVAVSRERLDELFGAIAETSFQREVLERRVAAGVEGRDVKLVSAEDLILFKLVAGRPRDLIDVQDVLFTQGELDEPYLRRWAGPLGVEARLDEVLAARE